jgi:hypothetical protein
VTLGVTALTHALNDFNDEISRFYRVPATDLLNLFVGSVRDALADKEFSPRWRGWRKHPRAKRKLIAIALVGHVLHIIPMEAAATIMRQRCEGPMTGPPPRRVRGGERWGSFNTARVRRGWTLRGRAFHIGFNLRSASDRAQAALGEGVLLIAATMRLPLRGNLPSLPPGRTQPTDRAGDVRYLAGKNGQYFGAPKQDTPGTRQVVCVQRTDEIELPRSPCQFPPTRL